MAQEDVRLSGTFLDSAGNAIADKTVTLFSEGTVTNPLTTDTTGSAGEWDFTRTTPGRYDVQLVNLTQTYRILSRDKFQVTELQSRNATSLTQPAGIFTNTYTNGGVAAAGLTAIHSFRPATESTGVESAVAGVNGSSVYNDFQLTNSASTPEDFIAGRMAFEAVDVTNGSEDSQLNLWAMTNGTLVEELHLNGAALWPETDAGLDLGTSALGFNDLHLGSGGVINFDGSDVTLTHSSNTLTVAGGTLATAALTATTITGSTSLVLATGATVTGIDNGSLGSSATLLATQGAIKTYVDAQQDTVDTWGEVLALGNASGGTGVVITAGDAFTVNTITETTGGSGVTIDSVLLKDNVVTATTFVGALTGNVTGNASGTAATVTGGTQASITTVANVVEVGALDAGSITSGFTSIDVGSGAITTTGLVSAGSLTVTGTTTLNGALVLGDAAGDTLDITASATVSTDFKFADNIDIALGTNADILMRNRSTAAAANLEITDIILGTSVHPGVAANSLLVSNITASGDIMFATNRGGNTEAHMLFDASAGDTFLYARGVEALKIAGGGAMTITPALTVTGALTLGTYVNADADVDKFLVVDGSGNVDFRTGAEVLSDIGAGVGGGDITGVTAGVGLSGGGSSGGVTLTLDLSELSTVTPADGDFFSTLDSDGANEQKTTTTALATLFAGTSLTASSSVISVDAATTSAAGSVELATSAEINTSTDAARAMTPDLFAASNYGIRYVQIMAVAAATALTVADGLAFFHVPAGLDGMDLVEVHAEVFTAPAGSTATFEISLNGASTQMLSTNITIDASETGSDTAATAAVINTSTDDLDTNDVIQINCTQVGSGTAGSGLLVTMGFRIP